VGYDAFCAHLAATPESAFVLQLRSDTAQILYVSALTAS